MGKEIEKNTFISPQELSLYFHNESSGKEDFGDYYILASKEINQPQENLNKNSGW